MKKESENALDLICVKTFNSRVEADLARGFLEANGVNAVVSTDSAGGVELGLEFMPGVRLLVKRKDASTAVELLRVEE